MPVDEFGREIPAVSAGGDDAAAAAAAAVGKGEDTLGGDGPSRLYEPLPTSRYDDDPSNNSGSNKRDNDGSRRRDRDDEEVGGGRRKRKHRDDHDDDDDDDYSRGRRGGGGGRDHHYHDRHHDRDHNNRRGGGGGRDYRDDDDYDRRQHNSEDRPGRRGGGSNSSGPHPSTLYTDESMLCQVLWKEDHSADTEGKTEEEAVALYDTYRLNYGLNYVRSFFNQHMDDSWFRARYSPLAQFKEQKQEIVRAQQEAAFFQSEMDASIEKNNLSSSSSSGTTSDPCFFVLKARLGGGVRHLSGTGSGVGHGYGNAMVNPVPASHVLKMASEVMPVRDVPPHVTDEQLTAALMSHATTTMDGVDAKSIVLHSGPPRINDRLMRTCYLQAPEPVRKEIIQQLHQLDRGIDASAVNNTENTGSHVPRKDETHLPKVLELEVECSDPYGRLEVDADGKGGEPEDADGVTPRKTSVWVSTRPLPTTVQVLSAALSTKKRIESDFEAARKLATAYDVKYNIPASSRLDSLLVKAVPAVGQDSPTAMSPQDTEDALDITIAYLRRVHLLSFYNGCTKAKAVSDVLNGDHPASTVHLRLSNADEILDAVVEDEEKADGAAEDDGLPVVDLLVTRLNDSIEKALAVTSEWDLTSRKSFPVVDFQTDADATALEEEENQVEPNWVADHCVMEDGRARCSFHFCRKLFKDVNFLKKHLLKKHPEFLRAEIAKCHDPYMMKAWDAEKQRPVPPVLVDCGHRFGLVPSPVVGDTSPMANDPEPALWERLEEERRLEEEYAEEQRQRKERQRQYRERQKQEDHVPEPSLDAALSSSRGTKRPEFVDVDDMQEEKVEMTFDDVEIPVPQPTEQKKKKKKRKLL